VLKGKNYKKYKYREKDRERRKHQDLGKGFLWGGDGNQRVNRFLPRVGGCAEREDINLKGLIFGIQETKTSIRGRRSDIVDENAV